MRMFELIFLFGGLTREVMEEPNHKPEFSNLKASISLYVFMLQKLQSD